MSIEAAPQQRIEDGEKNREQEIRECITHDRPVTSGSNALIFKTVDMSTARRSTQAVKVLKVYRSGAGEQEFNTLRRAYDLLSCESDAAQAPRPQNFVVLELHREERERLNSFGAHLTGAQPVEAFDMSFIEGKDFARIVYEEVIRRCIPRELLGFLRDGEQPRDLIEEGVSLEYLFDIVSKVLKLENPLRVDATGVPQNDLRVLWRNSKRIFEFLASRGFVVHPNIVSQLKKAIGILHKGGIHHNDLHERNLMIEGPIDADAGKVWVLDFGMAHGASSELETYRDDYSLVRLLEDCSKTKDERDEQEAQTRRAELEKEIVAHTANPTVFGIFTRYSKFGRANLVESVSRSLAASLQPKFDLAALKLLYDNDFISTAEAKEIIDRALASLIAKNIAATRSKSAKSYNPALQSLLKLARGLWQEE